jgi:tetratricopeptide (TPR) repeat protein
VILLGIIGSGAARADNLDEAKAAFAAGKISFERGDYDQALAQFQRANLLAPAPSLSYNIGKTYEKMGRYHDAVLAFERYLELSGAPQSDDDKKFQEELKGRIEADRATPDRPASVPQQPQPQQPQPQPRNYPPPQYQPQPYYNPYNPYAFNPYAQVQTKASRMAAARRKRNNGVTSFTLGAAFFIIGLAITVDSVVTPHDNFGSTVHKDALENAGNIIEIAFGIPILIVGPILIGTGAAGWSKGQGEMNRIAREPDAPPPPGQPAAVIFRSPTIRF